jgi:biopolymer transport protein ExbB
MSLIWNTVNWNTVNWNTVNWNTVNWNTVNWNTVAWPLAQTANDARQFGLDFFELLRRGGVFMIPIGIMSLIVVTFLFERWIGLRSSVLMPKRTVAILRGALSRSSPSPNSPPNAIDAGLLHQACLAGNSALDRIVLSATDCTGLSVGETQAAVASSIQREVDRAYANVRWLNLGAGIAPLLGLLGTVWGLIRAFHDTTKLVAGQNRADFLAVGIYEALVTTLAGLMVAIPAAVASHYLEGRISKVFRNIQELMSQLVPRLHAVTAPPAHPPQPLSYRSEAQTNQP